MKEFMDDNFLLHTEAARKLYFDYAQKMPIFDYHCHLQPREIWENKPYENITQVWLYGDHYKWRMMRAVGIDEAYITGGASDYDKFLAYARTMPYLIGNPLYHWTHLELRRFFGVTELLNERNAEAIWNKVNTQLRSEGFRPRDFIEKSNVRIVCTTDDPIDDLQYHKQLAAVNDFSCRVLPTFRPDKAVDITKEGFAEYIRALGQAASVEIASFAALRDALCKRIAYFHDTGCRVADHALMRVPYADADETELDAILQKALSGGKVTAEEEEKYKTAVLQCCAREYAKRGWGMQLHLNSIRNNNTRMFEKLGPDTGYDSILDWSSTEGLSRLFDSLEKTNELPRTILYSLNPNDNPILATMMGNFQGGGIAGKMQLGSAWWFNDHKDGMERQIRDLASVGVLPKFVGMLTDSRSFLSYPRHEYFRRILCGVIGQWVENGEYPADYDMLGQIVQDICYNNAIAYLGMK